MVVWMGNCVVPFGVESPIITLEAVQQPQEITILLGVKDPQEHLFTLSPSMFDPPIESENRTEALGFARKALAPLVEDSGIIYEFACWTISTACSVLSKSRRLEHTFNTSFDIGLVTPNDVFEAGEMLFALESLPSNRALWINADFPKFPTGLKRALKDMPRNSFLNLLFAFSRVKHLRECDSLPLSLHVFCEYEDEASDEDIPTKVLSLSDSFDYLSHLLVSKENPIELDKAVILTSGWG